MGVEQEEFKNTMKSIRTYGGFYIARYEGGFESTNCLIPVSIKGGSSPYLIWYEAYRNSKFSQNEDVKTSLIYRNQWDYLFRWLIETTEISNYDVNNSTSWGNYFDSLFQFTNLSGETVTKNRYPGGYVKSGLAEYTRVGNICDLAGNLREWSVGIFEKDRIMSGGCYGYSVYVKTYFSRKTNYGRDNYLNKFYKEN